MSGIEAHVLHADDFLALMLGDGVPDGHVIGGQVQLIGAGQRVIDLNLGLKRRTEGAA